MRKPVFGVSDHVRHKPGCTTTQDGKKLEISYLGSRGIIYYLCSVNKGADQLSGTAKLICVFVFAYAKSRFSHNEAHLVFSSDKTNQSAKLYQNQSEKSE